MPAGGSGWGLRICRPGQPCARFSDVPAGRNGWVQRMELVKRLALQGPNVWGALPILEVWVAAGPHRQATVQQLSAIARRLRDLAQPHLAAEEFRPETAAGQGADFVLAAWLEQLTRKMQSLSLVEMPAGRVLPTPDGQIHRVAIHFEDEGVVRRALIWRTACCRPRLPGPRWIFPVRWLNFNPTPTS